MYMSPFKTLLISVTFLIPKILSPLTLNPTFSSPLLQSNSLFSENGIKEYGDRQLDTFPAVVFPPPPLGKFKSLEESYHL